jgi:hypothetical protein
LVNAELPVAAPLAPRRRALVRGAPEILSQMAAALAAQV